MNINVVAVSKGAVFILNYRLGQLMNQ
jgi:hypothetical protein